MSFTGGLDGFGYTNTPELPVWGGVTDPTEHDPENFRYVVYAVNPMHSAFMPLVDLDSVIRGDYEPEPEAGDQTINLFEQPHRINERVSVSTSLIDQDHTGTFAGSGYILELPVDNVVLAGPQDLGIPNASRESLLRRAQQAGYIPTPEAILSQTSPTIYNEVAALAAAGPGQIAVRGVFIKTTPSGTPLEPYAADKLANQAANLGVPIVKIVDPNRGYADMVQITPEIVAVQKDGQRILLDSNGSLKFHALSEGNSSHFASPDEIDSALAVLTEQEVDPTLIEAIKTEYEATAAERSRAKISFNPDGTVSGISKVTGYGDGQLNYNISWAGYAHYISNPDYQRILEDAFYGSGVSKFGNNANKYTALSEYEVRQIVAEASQDLAPDQQEVVDAWLTGILPVVRRQEEYQSQQNKSEYGSYDFSNFGKYLK